MRVAHRIGVAACAIGIGACAAVSAPVAAQDPPAVNTYGAAAKAFRDRADAYLALQKKAADKLPPLKETDDPAKLTSREQALGEAIRQLRAGAAPGEVFGDELAPRIRKIVRDDWARRARKDKAALAEEIPPGSMADVNASYPSALPLATFPAALLAALPPLPEGLEYRFVGRHLIIRDVKANLIVDVLSNVLPGART